MRNYTQNYKHYLQTGKNIFFRADLHLIGGCNFRCIMCDNWKNKITINFSVKDFQKYIIILRKVYNCDYIRFHGQEPLLFPQIEKLILLAKKLKMRTAIKTNAWLLTERKLVTILQSWLDELYLSIDSPEPHIHDTIRGISGSFNKNISVIILARKIRPDLPIYINSVIMRNNFHSIDQMLDIAQIHHLNRVSFVFLNDKNSKNIQSINLFWDDFCNFFKNQVISIYQKSDQYNIPVDFSPFLARLIGKKNDEIIYELQYHFENYLPEIRAFYNGEYGKYFYDRYGCFSPMDHASINFDGNMYGCCVVERSPYIAIGNIREGNFEDLWNSEKYKKYRNNSNEQCGYASKCASNFYTRKKLFRSIYIDDNLYPKSNARNYYRYLKELFHEPWITISQIKVKKLQKILLYFFDRLSFYRELLEKNGIFRGDILNIENVEFIKRLPILTKETLIQYRDEIEKQVSWSAIIGSTSWTTWERLNFYYPNDFRRYIRQIAIFSEEADFIFSSWFFSLTPDNCNQFIVEQIDLPKYVKKIPILTPSFFDFSQEYFKEILEFFSKNTSVRYIHADPKYLLYIVLGFKKYNFPLPEFSLIALTYSYSNKNIKRFFESVFKAKIVDNYWCSETGPITCETNNKKIIFGDNIIVYDKNKKIIVTDLDNYEFPFINYENGDIGEVIDNEIRIFWKESQYLFGKNLQEVDDFIYNNFPNIITYQLQENTFAYISDPDSLINKSDVARKLSYFFSRDIHIIELKEKFFTLNAQCAKFNFVV